ncbi:MAG: AAA family ATPase [Nocardioidaceae bacterium]
MAPGDRRIVQRAVPNGHGPDTHEEWPASIPAVGTLLDEGLELPAGVTLLVGENGSGKSTIVEAVAMAFGLSPEVAPASVGTPPTSRSRRCTSGSGWSAPPAETPRSTR